MQALKEWATIVKALEDGKQTVILRKGGILETASGFKFNSKKFLLFPTYEHQESQHIKPEFQHYLSKAMSSKPRDGFNNITSVAEVVHEADITTEEQLQALSKFHIWSDAYVSSRKNWMPEKPLKAAFLKVYKVPSFEIALKPEFQGCKSWIEINSNDENQEAILNSAMFDSELKLFKEVVN